jgi:hypothetical protein
MMEMGECLATTAMGLSLYTGTVAVTVIAITKFPKSGREQRSEREPRLFRWVDGFAIGRRMYPLRIMYARRHNTLESH